MENVTSGDAVEQSLKSTEEEFENKQWNDPIYMATLYMTTMGSMGTISINVMDDLPEAVKADPMHGVPIMTDLLLKDLVSGEEGLEWFHEVISTPGFLGWAMVINGVHESEEGQESYRLVLFSSPTQGLFVIRRPVGGPSESGWVAEDALATEDIMPRALIRLNDISRLLQLQYRLFKTEKEANPEE